MQAIPKPKGRILCTEDDADSRELLVHILKAANYHFTVTANSAAATDLGLSAHVPRSLWRKVSPSI